MKDPIKYLVYRVHDEAGDVLYIGRTCNLPRRLVAHAHSGRGQHWLPDARSLSVIGPLTRSQAKHAEWAEIEAHQPLWNRMHTRRYGYARRWSA